jgi:serine phosphatase RsbU (regulator of sigma subunit)
VNQLGRQRQRLADLAARERDELANEIHLAAEVQQSILPRSIPTVLGFDFAARMYPSKIVAGDYYGFIKLPTGEIAVVIADVAGKGVAAGLLMPSIEVALRLDAQRFPSTSDLLHIFNNVVCEITRGHRLIPFFTGNSALSHVPWNIQMRDTIRRPCFVRVATQSPWTKEAGVGCASQFGLRE